MTDAFIVANLDEPSLIYRMHGGEGLARWKVLARRNSLFGSWEAVEWSWLAPGGASGEHIHTRTEELYFILSGSGEVTIDGQVHSVTAGDLVVSGLGTRHGLRNTGSQELTWLVIEVAGPFTTTVLSDSRQPEQKDER